MSEDDSTSKGGSVFGGIIFLLILVGIGNCIEKNNFGLSPEQVKRIDALKSEIAGLEKEKGRLEVRLAKLRDEYHTFGLEAAEGEFKMPWEKYRQRSRGQEIEKLKSEVKEIEQSIQSKETKIFKTRGLALP
jgi:chromosome segregation ATPase